MESEPEAIPQNSQLDLKSIRLSRSVMEFSESISARNNSHRLDIPSAYIKLFEEAIVDFQNFQIKNQQESIERLIRIVESYDIRHRTLDLNNLIEYTNTDWIVTSIRLEKNHYTPILIQIHKSSIHAYYYNNSRFQKISQITKFDSLPQSGLILHDILEKEITTPTRLGMWSLRKFKKSIFAIIALTLVASLFSLLNPLLLSWIIDSVLPENSASKIAFACSMLAIILLVKNLLEWITDLEISKLRFKVQFQLYSAIWDRLLRLRVGFFQKYPIGELQLRSLVLIQLMNRLHHMSIKIVLSILIIPFYTVLLLYFSIPGGIIVIGLSLAELAVLLFFGYRISIHAAKLATLQGNLIGFIVSLINGIVKIRSNGIEYSGYHQWAIRYQRFFLTETNIHHLKNVCRNVTSFFDSIGLLILLIVVTRAFGSIETPLTPGLFIGFLFAYTGYLASIRQISSTLVDIVDSASRMHLIQPILNHAIEPGSESIDPGQLDGSILIENLSFRYPSNQSDTLSNISCQINSGAFVAIVGRSGSGKSTLFRLLLGFERPTEGYIKYNKLDLQQLNFSLVRQQFGVVLQSDNLFAGTIYDNITSNRHVPAEQVWSAAEDAAIAEEIQSFPMNLFTPISDRGSNISGGQRQRLLLAKALLQNPRILFLDEATSSLDNLTQEKITRNLAKRNVTRVVVAHRLSTIIQADQIIVLDEGKIVQTGKYHELMATEGVFRNLASSEMS